MRTRIAQFMALIGIAALAATFLAGCGNTSSASSSVKHVQYVSMVSIGGPAIKVGPDKFGHDSMDPSDLTIYAGEEVDLAIYNYDEGPHSITAPDLNLNLQIPGRTDAGVASVTHFTFTAKTAGKFRWWCAQPCDLGGAAGKQKGWAMTNGPDGQPGQPGFMGGTITVI